MMDHMRGPEEPALVAGPVEPVVAEIIGGKEQKPRPPLITDFEDRESMDGSECSERNRLGSYSDQHLANAHRQAGSRALDLVQFATHHRIADYLHDKQK